ncbi:restriction endonuclease subunit S [Corynebacterium pygosceleis]|uniref:restriction endonuclease subunit S n=1 Tax=Corynebacterium pygosceleis TaxID=2800406 RepID=UPI002002F1EA|nr:restriction endonuclease subunit S [Corynebacterium pygosceleis]MCK7675744.1 restriction endonuclease subunit S [Corynebacterium pygosceleis]
MSLWVDRSIKDLCLAVVDCVNKTAPSQQSPPTPYKMLRTTNVRGGWVDTESVKYVDYATYTKWTRRMVPKRGDIILTREAPFGNVGMIRSDDQVFLGQRLVMYRADETECDPHFLMYSMMGPGVQAELKSLGSGSTVEHLRVPDCERITIPSPPLPEQWKIGAILRSLDDLIENNRRRVEVLEEMARSIYREWFVKFRYPGHEEVPMVDSALGPIPKGWEVAAASEAIEINPRIKLDRSVEHSLITMADLDERNMSCRPSTVRTGGSGAKFQQGDTLFARITPCLQNGKTGLVQSLAEGEVGLGSTEFVVLRGRLVGSAFTYCLAREDSFRGHAIASMSGASGRQRVRNECFDSYLLATPPKWLANGFETTVEPLISQTAVLFDESARLGALRDRLLPKLVTGQIDLATLDLDALIAEQVA